MELPAGLLTALPSAHDSHVQMFWFGDPLPFAHRVCLRSWVQQGYEPQLWCYDKQEELDGVTQRDATEVLPRELAQLWLDHPAVYAKQTFANFFRYVLLLRLRGGRWADTDLVCVQRLPEVGTNLTWTFDIPTRPELLDAIPTLPKSGGDILPTFFHVTAQDAVWLHDLVLSLWEPITQGRCGVFGTTGTVAFTKAIYSFYKVPPLRPIIGNCWHHRNRIFDDASWSPPVWASLLHLYNFTNPDAAEIVPDSCWSRILARCSM